MQEVDVFTVLTEKWPTSSTAGLDWSTSCKHNVQQLLEHLCLFISFKLQRLPDSGPESRPPTPPAPPPGGNPCRILSDTISRGSCSILLQQHQNKLTSAEAASWLTTGRQQTVSVSKISHAAPDWWMCIALRKNKPLTTFLSDMLEKHQNFLLHHRPPWPWSSYLLWINHSGQDL